MSLLWVAPSASADLLAGPVAARIVRVIDGDTLEAEASIWPGHSVLVSIRIRGIDAPEMRSACEAERIAAREARNVLAEIVADGAMQVRNVGADKYFGRVVADVATADGGDVAELLILKQVVRLYDGGHRPGFCDP